MEVPVKRSALYIAVWRWHFYAGIFVIPFALLLSVTGCIYLFRIQFEEWYYKDLLTVAPQGKRLSAEQIIAKSLEATPNLALLTYAPPKDESSSAVLLVSPRRAPRPVEPGHEGHTDKAKPVAPKRDPEAGFAGARELYVNPYSGAVLGSLSSDERPMQTVRNLHGKLLAGDVGDVVIELVAGWIAMLLVSGVYLWWPRQAFSVWGTFLPRLRSGARIFWRDLHAVPALYATGALIVILGTGIPWTMVAGKVIAKAVGPRDMPPEARAGRFKSQPVAAKSGSELDWFSEFPEATGAKLRSIPPAQGGRLSLDHVTVIAESQGMEYPLQISSPRGPLGVFSVRTLNNDPRKWTFLHVDQYSGKVLGFYRYDALNLFPRAVTLGIALHEGRLFGFWNQVFGLLACIAVFTLSGSAAILWWKRKPAGRLGAPRMLDSFQLPRGIVAISSLMAILFPVAGASLMGVLLFDWFILPRMPRMCRFLLT